MTSARLFSKNCERLKHDDADAEGAGFCAGGRFAQNKNAVNLMMLPALRYERPEQ
jgi:hypothetical protein